MDEVGPDMPQGTQRGREVNAQGLAELRNLVTRAKLDRDKERLPAAKPRRDPPAFRANRYATEEERVEARRRTWREYKKRTRVSE